MAYSEKYIDHFSHPRGVGEIESPDGWSEVQHEGGGCFDRVKMTLKVEAGRIRDAKYKARACSGTIAACSALVEMILDRPLAELASLDPDNISRYLDGVPEPKRHSVELAARALHEAIKNLSEINPK